MRRAILALAAGIALLPGVALAQNGVQTTPGVANNPLFPSGNPFNPVVPHGNNNGGNGPSVQDIMRMRMMQQMMGNRNPPKYGAAGMRAPIFNGQYQNPNMGGMVPFAQPGQAQQAPAADPAKVARDVEKAKAKQRADDIRAKDAAARERRKAKLLEEKAAREGLAPARPLPQPSEKVEQEEPAADEKAAEKPAEEKAEEQAADKE
jgi:hypothetical protein